VDNVTGETIEFGNDQRVAFAALRSRSDTEESMVSPIATTKVGEYNCASIAPMIT
jgi:hypothetical protein